MVVVVVVVAAAAAPDANTCSFHSRVLFRKPRKRSRLKLYFLNFAKEKLKLSNDFLKYTLIPHLMAKSTRETGFKWVNSDLPLESLLSETAAVIFSSILPRKLVRRGFTT